MNNESIVITVILIISVFLIADIGLGAADFYIRRYRRKTQLLNFTSSIMAITDPGGQITITNPPWKNEFF